MKKKGLIISTVVMVVVLIASLTTATYAWFTSTQAVAIDDITLSVKSSAKVQVGVKTGSGSTADDYMYESVSRATDATGNTVKWENGTPGLGAVLNFPELNIGGDRAVGVGTPAVKDIDGTVTTNGTVDAITNMFSLTDKKIIKAFASGATSDADLTSVEEATANVDYLHATIGVAANQDNVKGMYAKVVVTTDDNSTIFGMNSAVHIAIKNYEGKTVNVEPFGTRTYDVRKSSIINTDNSGVASVAKAESGQISSTFYFWIATSAEKFAYDGSAVFDFEILIYIDGADADCTSNALGTACKISISFDGTDDITNLGDDKDTPVDQGDVKFLVFA